MATKKRSRPGRPRNAKLNRSEAIRLEFEAMGLDTAPKDVIAKLAAKNIDVSPALVSNVRATLISQKKRGGRRGKPRRGAANGDMIAVSDLIDAKRLVERLGSIEKAKSTIDALAKISS